MPSPAADAVVDRLVEQAAGLVGHAEPSGTERLVDVLGRGAGERDLEVVDDRRAVDRDRRDEAALHQVDQHRAEAGLDHVRAEAPDDARRPRLRAARWRATTALKSAAASMSGSESTNAPTDRRARAAARSPRHAPCSRATSADTS